MTPAKVTPMVLDPDRVEAIKSVVAGLDGGVMGTTIKVSECVLCPLWIEHYYWCRHPGAPDKHGDVGTAIAGGTMHPDWCPLRSGPVTVELDEGAES